MDKDQPQSHKPLGNKPKSRPEHDDFDGDDLQLDDFLTAAQRRDKAKSTKQTEYPLDEVDWLSIGSSPSPPLRPNSVKAKADDWVADMGPVDDEDAGPIRLPNGKWACNHKCKDKTRYERTKSSKRVMLIAVAASTSAAVTAWRSHLSLANRGLSQMTSLLVSIN